MINEIYGNIRILLSKSVVLFTLISADLSLFFETHTIIIED